jgi:prefoldin subunit 5
MAIELKAMAVSAFIDETSFSKEVDLTNNQLAAICTEIANLEAQLAVLHRKKTSIETNLKDVDALNSIMGRMKMRETEGIK